MALVSDAQLAQMRSYRTQTLRDACVVTPAVAPGDTATPVSVACAVARPKLAGNGGGGSAIGRPSQHYLSVPWGTALHTGDRVTWQGKTLEVGAVRVIATYATAVHADCIEVGS